VRIRWSAMATPRCHCRDAVPADGGLPEAAAELPTCVSLLQGAWAASLHPAQGTGLLRLQVPAVLSVFAGARTRRATRPSARAHRWAPAYALGLFVPAVEAASEPAAPRRDAPSGQPDQARHGGVGRPGLTPARAPSSWVCAPA